MAPAQAFVSSYAPRLRQYANTLLQPVLQTQSAVPAGRTTKRGTTIINYADDAYDDDDFDDSEGPRRPTGLRSIRREDLEKKDAPLQAKYGKEISQPVDVQSIYRDWMIRRRVKPSTDREAHIQAQLPLTLIPIRIDLEIQGWQPDAPYPLPPQQYQASYNLALPQYRRPEPAPTYKIRDIVLWNLHESLTTPDDFALNLVQDLDLDPIQIKRYAGEISSQIRNQLEDWAGVALHPLFYTQPILRQPEDITNSAVVEGQNGTLANGESQVGTPRAQIEASISRPASATPQAMTPATSTPQPVTLPNGASIVATASPIPVEIDAETGETTGFSNTDPSLNPDDTYRCIIQLSVYLASKLYQDKFEWSLLHPPGAAEEFAKQTCADMGLGGEWALAITHAIYEAVLRLKKEVCEGGLVLGSYHDNQAIREEEGAGWRYDIDDFGAEWEPKFEELNKEEIEKREGDRERQLRRLRRDASKLASTAGMLPSQREQEAQARGSYFDMPAAGGAGGEDTPSMGRGERSKKKRRFRSLSPLAKAQTPDVLAGAAAWGGEGSRLTEDEKRVWRCRHCFVWAGAVWAVRDGPHGPRVSSY
jgi:chromatin structure-remodeling complex subunit SFH1